MKKWYCFVCAFVFFVAPLAAQQEKEYLITASELTKLEKAYLSLETLNQNQRQQVQVLAGDLKLSKKQSVLLMIKLKEARELHKALTQALSKNRVQLAKSRASFRAFEKEAESIIQKQKDESELLTKKLKRRTATLIALTTINIAFIAMKAFKGVIGAKLRLIGF